MTLFLVHTLSLLWVSHASIHRLVRARADRVLAVTLLAWGNLVVTSLLLSGVHRLGEPAWFFRTSLVLAGATWLLLRRIPSEPAGDDAAVDRPDRWLLAGFVLTLLPLVYASVRIAATYEPNNFDSLTYHLPRAMFYLGQNSLAHFATGNDRQIYFPLNYNLLQLFGLIYGPPLQGLNFINLTAWAVAGLAVWRLCRLCACRANTALVATWLALTSTQVLAQATATTNDLPTGAGLLCALVFALRWRQSRLTRDALLAGLAAGLAAGSKLTVIFFGPAAGLIVLVLAWQHGRRGEVRAFFLGVKAWLAPALLAFALASPFALINLAEKGEWINRTYDYTLNRPFSPACAAQTSAAYLVQLFLEPVHRVAFNQKFTGLLNAWGEHTFFPRWNAAHAFSPLHLFLPDLNEDHVWFGFAGPFIFLCAVFCLARFRRVAAPAVWLAALGLGWLAAYFLLNKWSLYNQRYFIPAMLVMSPCVAVFAAAAQASPWPRRASRALLVLVAGSALWLAGIYLFQNSSRPYAPLWAGQPPPPALPDLPPLLVQRLAAQPRLNILATDGNERIFLLMTPGRHQRFTSFARVVPDSYNVFSEWAFVRKVAYDNIEQPSSTTPVVIATKRSAGVEFLGTIGSGTGAQDYYGLVPRAGQTPPAADNRQVLVSLFYALHDSDRYARTRIRVAGLNPEDLARLTVGVEYADGRSEDLATFSSGGDAPAAITRPFRRFTIRVEDQATGQPIGGTSIPYLHRSLPPEVEGSDDPNVVYADELILAKPETQLIAEGLAPFEGANPGLDLPPIRRATAPVVRLEIPATDQVERLETIFSLRPATREFAHIDVVLNGRLVQDFALEGGSAWSTHKVRLMPQAGKNILEFRNVSVGPETDWLEYLERYPDVKDFLVSRGIPLEKGAQEHYELKGRAENRVVHLHRRLESLPESAQPYFQFRSLRVYGFRHP